MHCTDYQAVMQNLYNLSYLKCVDCGLDEGIMKHSDFPGGTLVKNRPCKAENAGLIPSWGIKFPHATEQLLSSPTTAGESVHHNKKDPA